MMETTNQLPVREPPSKRFTGFFAEHYEHGAFYILLLWCLLPVLMSVNYLISGMLGKYPTAAELIREGLTPGNVNYSAALQAYQTLFFILGAITFCFALLCVVLCRRRVFSLRSVRRMPWFYLLSLFLLWATISSLRADSLDISLLGSSYMRDGLVSYYIYGSVFLCAAAIQQEKHRKTLLRVFTAVMCYMALIVLVQENANNDFINYCFSSRRAAVFNQFNHFGYMLCMAITTAFGLFLYDREGKKGLRWLYLAAAAFLSYVLVINNTFGAMLAALVALPVVLIFYLRSGRKLNRRAVALVLLLIVLAGVCFFALSSGKNGLIRNFTQLKTDLVKIITHADDAGSAGTDRFALWQETVGKIAERPIMGFGAEGLSRDNALISGAQIGLLPHNTYLQIAAYLGIVGLVIYLAALLCLAIHHWKHMRELDPMVLVASGAAFAYLVSAFVGCPVFNTEPYFWLFLGLVTTTREGAASLFSFVPEEEFSAEAEPGLLRTWKGFDVKKRRVLYSLIVLLILGLFAVGAGLSHRNEKRRELADLQAMHTASTVARRLIDPATLTEDDVVYYWFDKNRERLLPASMSAPAPYGQGSANSGGGTEDFYKEYGFVYNYDEKAEYAGKIIVVAATSDSEGGLKLAMTWVEPNP